MSGSYKNDYILSPVDAHAHVKRNRSEKPIRHKGNPRIVCDLTLEDVPLALSDVRIIIFVLQYF